jgi:hypothetical protein
MLREKEGDVVRVRLPPEPARDPLASVVQTLLTGSARDYEKMEKMLEIWQSTRRAFIVRLLPKLR